MLGRRCGGETLLPMAGIILNTNIALPMNETREHSTTVSNKPLAIGSGAPHTTGPDTRACTLDDRLP